MYFLEQAATFINKYHKRPKKLVKKQDLELPIPFILGCDLQSKPHDAAFDMLIGKDIFDKSTTW